MKLTPLVLLPFLLIACSPDAKVSEATVQGVQVRYDGSDAGLDKANELAREKCSDYGRASALLSSSKTKDNYVASYECRRGEQ